MQLEILYVEDNPAEVFLLCAAVQKIDPGLVFTTVGDGEAAIEFLYRTKDRPCVIVIDLGLPKIDGVEVFRTVKSTPDFKHVPTVVFAEHEGRRKVERTGYLPDLFLTKPMDLDGYGKIAEQIVELCRASEWKPQGAAA
jgi:two-component system response regulator